MRDLRAGSNGDGDPESITPQVDGRFWFTARRGPRLHLTSSTGMISM